MVRMTKPSKRNKHFLLIKIAGIILIPAILFILPYHFFDHRGPVCLFTLLSGYECIGCGMTRACQRLIHFRIADAYSLNKLSIGVFPILIYLWIQEGIDTYKKLKHVKNQEN